MPASPGSQFQCCNSTTGVAKVLPPWFTVFMPAKPDPNTVATTVRLPRQLVEQLDAIAQAERRSRNFIIEHLLVEALRARQ